MRERDYKQWATSLQELLSELTTQDFGYPLGVNEIFPPEAETSGLPEGLRALYAVCDGLSLPDVHAGYFVDRAARVKSNASRGEPTTVSDLPQKHVVVFGSDGGGGRFAIEQENGVVLYLPAGGVVKDGVFIQDPQVHVRRVAHSMLEFLYRLSDDVEAFSAQREGHRYLTDGA